MGTGFRSTTVGNPAAPPYTQGPYTFSEDITFEGDVVVEGSFTFGDVSADELTITGFITTADAKAAKFLETGTYQSTASGGMTLSATNKRPSSFLHDDAGVALGAGDYRALLSRVLLTIDQSNAVTLNAMRGQVKLLDGIDVSSASSVVAPVQGYFELAGTGARSLSGHVAGVRSAIEEGASGTTTVAASSFYAGFEATLNSTRSYTVTGDMAGFMCNISGGTSVWPVGFLVVASSCTTGIEVQAATTGINISGACTDGLIIAGACSDNGIEISGACSGSAVEIVTGAFGIGVNVNADGTTGVAVSSNFSGTTMLELAGTGSAGVLISGACTEAIDITGTATTAINVDTGTFTTGMVLGGTLTTGIDIGQCTTGINVGTFATPITFTTDSPLLMVSGNAAADLSSGVTRCAWFRSKVSIAQTGVSIMGIEAQCRINDAATLGAGQFTGSWNYFEQSGTTALSTGCLASGSSNTVETAATFTIDSGAILAGVVIDSSVHASTTNNGTFDAVYIKKAGGALDFANGIEFTDCVSGNIFKFADDGTIVSVTNGSILNDISGTTNAGFIKVEIGSTTRYIAVYDTKS